MRSFTDDFAFRSGMASFEGSPTFRGKIGTSIGEAPVTAESMTQGEWLRSRQSTNTAVNAIDKSLQDTSIVDNAQRRVDSLAERSSQAISRSLGRRVSTMTPAQQRMIQSRLAASVGQEGATAMTGARIAQRDVRTLATAEGANTAALLSRLSSDSLSAAEGMKMQRDATNNANRAQSRSGLLGTLGTIGGAAAGFMLTGGNPAGAALGASLGGAVGGSI